MNHHFVSIYIPPLFWCTLAGLLSILYPFYMLALLVCLTVLASSLYVVFDKISGLTVSIFIFSLLSSTFTVWHYNHICTSYNTLHRQFSKLSFDCLGVVYVCENNKSTGTYSVTVKVIATKIQNKSLACSFCLKISTLRKPTFLVGDTIIIHNITLKPIQDKKFEQLLMKENIIIANFMPTLSYDIISHPRFSLRRSLYYKRENLIDSITSKMNKDTKILFSSLFLGSKLHNTIVEDSLRMSFTTWGIVHFLARSGLHIVLIASLWTRFLNFIPVPFFLKHVVILLLLLIYHLLSWPSISFLRALLTFVLYRLCFFHIWPIYPLSIISLVSFLVLTYNPLEIFSLDFQLSFTLTLALAWINEVLIKQKRIPTIDSFFQNALN